MDPIQSSMLLKIKSIQNFVHEYQSKKARLESLDILGQDTGGIPWTRKSIEKLDSQILFLENSRKEWAAKLLRQEAEKIAIRDWLEVNASRYEGCEALASEKLEGMANRLQREIRNNVG